MSFNDEINRLREEIEKAEKEIIDIIGASSSRLSDIESKWESETDRGKLWGELGELRGLKHQIKNEMMKVKHDLKQSLHEARDRIYGSKEYLSSEEFREEVDDRREELEDYIGDKIDEIGDKVDSFSDRVEEVEDKIKEKIKDWKSEMKDVRKAYVTGFSTPEICVPEIRVPEIKIPNVGRLIEESLSKAWTGVPSAIVSSVRLPQADLSLIDMLSNAGIFKSRNEGIAFFAHRGIEASAEWLTKVKEKLDDIKKLQEETKREIDKVVGVSTTPSPTPTPKSEDEKGEQGEREGEAQ